MNPFRVAIFALALCTPAAAQPPAQKVSVLFTAGNKPVTTEEFEYLFRKNHPKKEDYTEAKISDYVDLLVTFKIKVAEAEARGYDTTRSFHKELATYKSELKKPYLADKDQVTRLAKQAYERMTIEVRASHLLVGVPASPKPADTLAAYTKAIAFRNRILQGEDFATLARANSEDPTARNNAGDLGYFTVFQMVYPFEDAVYNLRTGEVSLPVRTRFGYHLIRVTDKRMARGEVEISHIILRTSVGDDIKVKTKIFELQSELKAGRSWDEVCREYSDDASTKNTGGRLRPFGVGVMAGIPQFEQAAFSLQQPGEISDPFQTAYGWHIIRLERKIPVPPFEQAEESLRRRISRDERLRIAEDRLRAEKLKRFGYVENDAIMELVLDQADSTLAKARWRFHGSADLWNQTLFTFNSKPFTVGAFVRYAEGEQVPHTTPPRDYLAKLLGDYVNAFSDELEDEALMKQHPEFSNLVKEYKEGILLFTIMEKEVWNRATEDTLGLRAWYGANNGRYAAGERVRARIFSSEDSLFVQGAHKKIQSGDTLTRVEVRKFKSIQGPRNYAPGESKAVDRAPKVMGVHKVKVESTYYLVEVERLVPPGVRTLEEIRSQVISDYQDHLEKEWVRSLRAKYPVKVKTKARKTVIRELTKS